MELALSIFQNSVEPNRKVRLLGVRFSELEEGAYQINLFDDREKDVLLYKAIDEMKAKHGKAKIILAQNLNPENVKQNDPKAILNRAVKRNVFTKDKPSD